MSYQHQHNDDEEGERLLPSPQTQPIENETNTKRFPIGLSIAVCGLISILLFINVAYTDFSLPHSVSVSVGSSEDEVSDYFEMQPRAGKKFES